MIGNSLVPSDPLQKDRDPRRIRRKVTQICLPLWWALTHTPLVLMSNHSYIKKFGAHQFWCALLWRRRSNCHILDLGHPLAVLETTLWSLLLEAAVEVRAVETIIPTFFGNEIVAHIMQHSERDAALGKYHSIVKTRS